MPSSLVSLLPALVLLSARARAAPAPAPVPPLYYETFHHTQRADHFNAESHATFPQRYLVNRSWWKGAGAPILLYTGAEGVGVDAIFAIVKAPGMVILMALSVWARR